jgi:S1-C subfamily serine protease
MIRLNTSILLVVITLVLSACLGARRDDLSDVRLEIRTGLSAHNTERPLASAPGTPRGGSILVRPHRGPLVYQQRVNSVALIASRDGFGAGAVISAQGDIVTNEHVVRDAHRARGGEWVAVWFKPASSRSMDLDKFLLARVIRKNSERDLALLHLADPLPAGATAIPLAAAPPDVGQNVFTIGHPKAYLWSFAQGVVAQVRPSHTWSYNDGIRRNATAIQTQTPLNPGSSGGPLLDEDGAIVGVVVGVAPDAQGIHFAVAAEHVKELLKR